MKIRTVYLATLPPCQICNGESIGVSEGLRDNSTPAVYDALTMSGQWGYVCQRHFDSYCIPAGAYKLELAPRKEKKYFLVVEDDE